MFKKFPKLNTLELADQHYLTKFIKKYPPYNDFEFLSLWVYNIENKNAFSILNNNLVIKIQDFITGDFFYSFIGTNRIKETIAILLEKSKKENLGNQLRLIPEISIDSSPGLKNYFKIKEDPDSFDYILSVNEISELKGGKYHDKRNLIKSFNKHHPQHIVRLLDFNNETTGKDILDLFFHWEKLKGKNKEETAFELIAIKRLIHFAHILKIEGVGVYNQSRLIGFITYHIVHDGYSIISFQKGDMTCKGIYEYLNNLAAKQLKKSGVIYINYEQDLGIPSLKKAKMLWRPVFFLKKYTIEEVS